MGRVTKTQIIESPEQLLQMSKKIAHPLASARLRAFYLYKSGQASAYGQIAATLGYERHAVGHWFKLYRQQGLQACLSINPGGHQRPSQIEGKVLEQLQAKLADANNLQTTTLLLTSRFMSGCKRSIKSVSVMSMCIGLFTGI